MDFQREMAFARGPGLIGFEGEAFTVLPLELPREQFLDVRLEDDAASAGVEIKLAGDFHVQFEAVLASFVRLEGGFGRGLFVEGKPVLGAARGDARPTDEGVLARIAMINLRRWRE